MDAAKPPVVDEIADRKRELFHGIVFGFTFHIVHTTMNNMESEEAGKIKVYYDGLCRACSLEIGHYRSQTGAENIQFIDICAPGFDALLEGLDPIQVHKEMHVRRSDGSLATRVEAFIVIWETLPKFRFLVSFARQKQIRACLELGYSIFAKIRPWLPRKAAQCQDSPYCENKKGP
jgi:predicted DCC family thiol-disulfide oxidoreductase YuxK